MTPLSGTSALRSSRRALARSGSSEKRSGAAWTRPLLIASIFAAVELVTGVVSMAVSALAVPPFVGAGLILDVVIFATGMTLVLAIGLAKEKAVPPP